MMHSLCKTLAAGATTLCVLAGCAAPPTTGVVLLPQEDGSASAVRVMSAGEARKLSQPYERATAVLGSPIITDKTTAAEVQATYPEIFALRPAKPQRFVIYFEAGGSALSADAQQTLQDALTLAQSRPGADMVITGHSDTTGEAAENDALSLRRAQQVRDLLMQSELYKQRPLPAQRIEAAGRGERELAVPTADNVEEAKNRRVEILVR